MFPRADDFKLSPENTARILVKMGAQLNPDRIRQFTERTSGEKRRKSIFKRKENGVEFGETTNEEAKYADWFSSAKAFVAVDLTLEREIWGYVLADLLQQQRVPEPAELENDPNFYFFNEWSSDALQLSKRLSSYAFYAKLKNYKLIDSVTYKASETQQELFFKTMCKRCVVSVEITMRSVFVQRRSQNFGDGKRTNLQVRCDLQTININKLKLHTKEFLVDGKHVVQYIVHGLWPCIEQALEAKK